MFGGSIEKKEVSLLEEELVHLSVKSSLIDPKDSPTLVCTVWSKKLYNPESFKAQLKSIWKTK